MKHSPPHVNEQMRNHLIEMMDALGTLGFVDPHRAVNGGDLVNAMGFVARASRRIYNLATQSPPGRDEELFLLTRTVHSALAGQGFYNERGDVNGADATDAMGEVYCILRGAPGLVSCVPRVLYSAERDAYFTRAYESEGSWSELECAEVLHSTESDHAFASWEQARAIAPDTAWIIYENTALEDVLVLADEQPIRG